MTTRGTRVAPFVFLNNRYHDPTLGGFISVDPLVAITGQAYVYAGANPVSYSDPTGLYTECADPDDPCHPSNLWNGGAEDIYSSGPDYYEYSKDHGGYIPGDLDGETPLVEVPVFNGCYFMEGGTDLLCDSGDVPDWALVGLEFDHMSSNVREMGGSGRALARLLKLGITVEKYSNGGHHIISKVLFRGHTLYAAGGKEAANRWALSLSDDVLKSIGTTHRAVSGRQVALYAEYAKSGRQLTFKGVFRIETKALTQAGVDPVLARTIVRAGLDDLIKHGVTHPTWFPRVGSIV